MYEEGKWLVTLSLLEHSPPTWIDSRLLVEDPQTLSKSDASRSNTPSIMRKSSSSKLKPTIELRIRTNTSQLQPHGYASEIGASLDDSLMGSSLQYE